MGANAKYLFSARSPCSAMRDTFAPTLPAMAFRADVPRRLPTAAGAPSAAQARTHIIPGEVERSCRRQLICLDQLPLVAVGPKAAYPIEINPDRAPEKDGLAATGRLPRVHGDHEV